MRNRNLVVPLALVLALMSAAGVLLYTRNVRSEAGSGGPTTPVVVAAVDVPAGTQFDELIANGDLVTQQIPTDYVVPGAVADVEELAGTTAAQPLLEGEQVSADRVAELGTVPGGGLGIPEGFSAISMQLPAAQTVGASLHRGDNVRIFATFHGVGSGGKSTTVALLPNVLVLDAVALGGTETRAPNVMLTLAVTPEDAAKFAFAQDTATLWVNLLAPDDKGRPPAPIELDDATSVV
jgi:Flp pilus assembly protein CpaB